MRMATPHRDMCALCAVSHFEAVSILLNLDRTEVALLEMYYHHVGYNDVRSATSVLFSILNQGRLFIFVISKTKSQRVY